MITLLFSLGQNHSHIIQLCEAKDGIETSISCKQVLIPAYVMLDLEGGVCIRYRLSDGGRWGVEQVEEKHNPAPVYWSAVCVYRITEWHLQTWVRCAQEKQAWWESRDTTQFTCTINTHAGPAGGGGEMGTQTRTPLSSDDIPFDRSRKSDLSWGEILMENWGRLREAECVQMEACQSGGDGAGLYRGMKLNLSSHCFK